MNKFATVMLMGILLFFRSCSPVEQQARNTAAALQGTIVAAQAKYHDSCVGNPRQQVCEIINQGISGQNALVTAVETYCGWSTVSPPADPNTKCVPVKTAEQGLQSAIANAAQLTAQIKGAL